MPIYEYHCLDCKKDQEIIQKASEKALRKCPLCGGKMQKKMSLSSFQLKGGGWYASGYSKGDTKNSSEASKKAKPAPVTASTSPAATSTSQSKTSDKKSS